jgi:hypothetical protein
VRDADYSPFKGASQREPRLELLETCWRFTRPNGRTLECGIYATDASLELRAGYGPKDLIRSKFGIEIDAAREIKERMGVDYFNEAK